MDCHAVIHDSHSLPSFVPLATLHDALNPVLLCVATFSHELTEGFMFGQALNQSVLIASTKNVEMDIVPESGAKSVRYSVDD